MGVIIKKCQKCGTKCKDSECCLEHMITKKDWLKHEK